MVSATVPNIQDVSAWIGTNQEGLPTRVFEVGRPSQASAQASDAPLVRGRFSPMQTFTIRIRHRTKTRTE